MKKIEINSIKSLIYGIINRIAGLRVGVMAMSALIGLRRCGGGGGD